jgi:outer membrane protein TolC
VKTLQPILNLTTAALLGAATLCLPAQTGTVQSGPPDSLPAAPSAVAPQATDAAITAQYAIGPMPGSSKLFMPGSTFAGPGSLRVERAASDPLPLSIDDAVAFGLARNLRTINDRANQQIVRGDLYQVTNAIVPSIRADLRTSTQEINLAAMGFKPGSIAIPGFNSSIPSIVKVDVTQALLNVNQTLFNVPAFELLRGARDEEQVVNLNALAGRGDLILAVGTAYLKIIADQSSLANAQALERSANRVFTDAVARRDAGVGTNLDALRGQVEFQNRQQQRISAETALAKDTIQLNRIMGIPAEQKLLLTDTAPFTQLADMDLDRAKTTAYDRRKDYLSLLAQMRVADRERLAVKYQRLPTIAFGGYYGVLGETRGLYHGVFNAQGSLRFPIFREAGQRGDTEVITAQLMALRQREADLRNTIEAQIRSAMLDVNSSHELVKVAQSNVQLAQETLGDEQQRFTAGVETNLRVVDAQAALAGAQAQLVQALYQYNGSKLQLARATGIIETQYRTYLGTNQ